MKGLLGLLIAASLVVMAACGDEEAAIPDDLVGMLETDAVIRILDEDSGLDPETEPFRETIVVSDIGGDTDRPVDPIVVGLLEYSGRSARFTNDPDTEIAELGAVGTSDIAVVVIDDLRFDGERAEIDVRLWCGDACDVALTYEAEMGPERFMITGVAD